MSKQAKKESSDKIIAQNKKAHHDFTIESRYEAGVVLLGWEVKSLRAGKAQISDSYVRLKKAEAFWIGGQINPLISASTHVNPDPTRTRKLLLHRKELNSLIGLTERKGYTLIPLKMYWKNRRVKIEIGLALGKKKYDKREYEKDKDWERQRQRIMKKSRV